MKKLIATALVGYLVAFSSAALVHAYAQDELTDPHGCAIGAWVQYASATDASAPPSAVLVCLGEFLPSSHHQISRAFVFSYASRGPPFIPGHTGRSS
jgi:hypothetical protein